MSSYLNLESFLLRNRIATDVWQRSEIGWEDLQTIAADHDQHFSELQGAAEFLAGVLQKIESVHSVRWRIKNTEHLLEKIIRKRAANEVKYENINVENYISIVTDLVGIRAIHLFKGDCIAIHAALRDKLELVEKPIVYIREGDSREVTGGLPQQDVEEKKHPAGYRSIHYVCSTRPLQRQIISEIQVRTIFEEGWSEIDHRVRYPNYTDDPLIGYFLTIFNRMAGSADEMGAFVQGLALNIDDSRRQVLDAENKRDEALQKIENLLAEMEAVKKEGVDNEAKISALQQEVSKIRNISRTDKSADGILGILGNASDYYKRLVAEDNKIKETITGMGILDNAKNHFARQALGLTAGEIAAFTTDKKYPGLP